MLSITLELKQKIVHESYFLPPLTFFLISQQVTYLDRETLYKPLTFEEIVNLGIAAALLEAAAGYGAGYIFKCMFDEKVRTATLKNLLK